jgi:hypothetical protein
MSIAVRIEAQYQEFMNATKLLREMFAGAMDGMRTELKAMSDEAQASMQGSESAFEQFANILKARMSGVTGVVEGVKTAWAQLAVVMGAAVFLGQAVNKTVELVEEAKGLGRELGISATQASVLKAGLSSVNATADDFLKLSGGLTTQLKQNEEKLKAFGLATRDANGELLPQSELVMNALSVLRGYKEGTDRNIAAQVLFGKGIDTTSGILDLSREKMAGAREEAERLGLVIGQDDVEAAASFKQAMNAGNDIIDAMMKAIGDALLPVLSDLAEWFKGPGIVALQGIKGAIAGVTTLFYGLSLGVKIVWEIVVNAFTQMATAASTYGEVVSRVLRGDFSGALAAAGSGMLEMQKNAAASMDSIMAKASDTHDSLAAMWGPIANGKKIKDSGVIGGAGTQGVEEDTSEAEAAAARAAAARAAAARRAAAAEMRAKREAWQLTMEKLKGEEQAAKDNLQELLDVHRRHLESAKKTWGDQSKEAQQAANKVAETQRKLVEQAEQLDLMRAGSARNLARIQIDAAEAAAEAEYQLGYMSGLQLIDAQRGFAQERYELERAALMDEALANQDRILDHEQTLLAIEELDAQHRARTREFEAAELMERQQMQAESQMILEQGFANAIANMVKGTMTFKQAMRSMFADILGGFIQMLAQWAARQMAAYVLDRVMHKTNLLTKKGVEKASAASTITTQAAIAGASGTASFAGAPWPINMGAPAFGAAMAAASGAYGAGLAAEKGFDIPAGMNPVTQLHQKEMVLPAEQADVIRGMASGRIGGQDAGGNSYQIVAHDVRGFQDYLRRNPAALADGVRYAARRGHAGVIEL